GFGREYEWDRPGWPSAGGTAYVQSFGIIRAGTKRVTHRAFRCWAVSTPSRCRSIGCIVALHMHTLGARRTTPQTYTLFCNAGKHVAWHASPQSLKKEYRYANVST